MSDPATPAPKNIDYSESMNVGRVHESVKREKDINQAGSEPVSLGVYLLLTPLLLVAGMFVGVYHDGGQTPKVPAFDANLADTGSKILDPVAEGRKLYVGAGCVACHQQNGQGQAGVYPPLVDSEWVTGSDKRMAMLIYSGMVGPITVNGNLYNNAMPAQGPLLNAKKLAYIMSFLRQEWGGGASLVTPEQAQLVFDELKDRTEPWTVAELEAAVPADEMLPKVGSNDAAAPAVAPAAAPAAATTEGAQ
ncbi:MAG: mono/diheme cytochrome c family protein [Verrucomicrobiales bacterium]|jgi:mono/diheme cytochrome c family protein